MTKTWPDGRTTSEHACESRCALDFPHDQSYHGQLVDRFLAEHAGHAISCGACLDCEVAI